MSEPRDIAMYDNKLASSNTFSIIFMITLIMSNVSKFCNEMTAVLRQWLGLFQSDNETSFDDRRKTSVLGKYETSSTMRKE